MWHFISEQISEQIQQDFICDNIRDMPGGNSHRCYKISDDMHRFFVKTNTLSYLVNFETEAEGLHQLRRTNLFKVPRVICSGKVSDHSFLVLEYINMSDRNEQDWFIFGQNLAHLHQSHIQLMYGWQNDNYIGLTPQPNQWNRNWSVFFAEQRIGYMLQLLAEQNHKLANIDSAVAGVQNLLAGHNPVSSMLHGDLWQGNIGFSKTESVLFDPAFYYGDRETDIAMSELFGMFPTIFYQGYEDVWPLPKEYQYRKSVYQLYHVLNHALVFGGNYLQSAKAILVNL